jgi:general stress protein CsbA
MKPKFLPVGPLMKKKVLIWVLGLTLSTTLALGYLVFHQHEVKRQQEILLQQNGAVFVQNCFEKLGSLSYQDSEPFAPLQRHGSHEKGSPVRVYLDHFLEIIRKNQWIGQVLHTELLGASIKQDSPDHFVLVSVINDPVGSRLP